jgi:hypothetical protein
VTKKNKAKAKSKPAKATRAAKKGELSTEKLDGVSGGATNIGAGPLPTTGSVSVV